MKTIKDYHAKLSIYGLNKLKAKDINRIRVWLHKITQDLKENEKFAQKEIRHKNKYSDIYTLKLTK